MIRVLSLAAAMVVAAGMSMSAMAADHLSSEKTIVANAAAADNLTTLVAAVQAAGMRSMVWTADKPADLQRALSLGVDGVISNRPDALQRMLEERLIPA